MRPGTWSSQTRSQEMVGGHISMGHTLRTKNQRREQEQKNKDELERVRDFKVRERPPSWL